MSRYYIAYGSNLSVEQMKHRTPDAKIIGTSVLEGWRLLFKGCATIEPKEGREVPVLIWEISDTDEKNLDRYEGYPIYYYKRYFQLSIRTLESGRPSGKRRKCMAYVLHEDRQLVEPSMEYFNLLHEGYEKWGFDASILQKALADSIGSRNAKKYLKEYTRLCW